MIVFQFDHSPSSTTFRRYKFNIKINDTIKGLSFLTTSMWDQSEFVGIGLKNFDNPILQNLNCDVVVDVILIYHHREVAEEEKKITQTVSVQGMARIRAADRVNPL